MKIRKFTVVQKSQFSNFLECANLLMTKPNDLNRIMSDFFRQQASGLYISRGIHLFS